MKGVLPAVAVGVLVSAIGVMAQEPGSSQGRGAGAGSPAAKGKITVDGCVQNAPAGSTSTSKYILAVRPAARAGGAGRAAGGSSEAAAGAAAEADAPAATPAGGATEAPGSQAPAPATVAPGAGARGRGTGGPPAPAGPVRYQLDGDEKIITPHLNHVVEVTGTLSGQPAPPARGGGAGAAPITQTLKIESLKMVAALCS